MMTGQKCFDVSMQRIRYESLICKVNIEIIHKSFTRNLTKCIDPCHVIFIVVYAFCRLLYIYIYLTLYLAHVVGSVHTTAKCLV